MDAQKESCKLGGKRRDILEAAADVFLRDGYVGASIEDIAAFAVVSKATIYRHFASKEALFVAIVTSMANATSDYVHNRPLPEMDDATGYLEEYALRQLAAVLTPRLMQLHRLVIGEVSRFPELARVLWEHGPQRATAVLAEVFKHLAHRGLLSLEDAAGAASHFHSLILSGPLNKVMLLGDEAIPTPEELHRQAISGVTVFLKVYGR